MKIRIVISTLSLALGSFCVLFTLSEGNVEDQIGPLSEELWNKVSAGWMFIISGDLNDFFLRYVNIDRELFNLLEFEFTSGDQNWIIDFQDLNMTLAYSRAYYRLLDVYEGTFGIILRTLTIEDMDKIVTICERHNLIGDTGIVNKDQFLKGFKEVIFRGVGSALLFVTYKTNPEIIAFGYDHVTREEFSVMVEDMDVDGNGEITSLEMGLFWTTGNYGSTLTGMTLFSKLDYNNDNVIHPAEMDELYDDLDCRSGGNGFVDFKEFMQLDLILRGLRDYPGGKCITDYTEV